MAKKGEVKMTPKVQAEYLKVLADIGVKNGAARAVGVCPLTVRNFKEANPEFEERETEALADYAESIRREVYRRAVNGVAQLRFHKGMPIMVPVVDENGDTFEDEDGNIVLEPYVERQYSDRLLELEAKRVDPGYRDKSSVDMNVKGGVLVVPGTKSEDEWENEET